MIGNGLGKVALYIPYLTWVGTENIFNNELWLEFTTDNSFPRPKWEQKTSLSTSSLGTSFFKEDGEGRSLLFWYPFLDESWQFLCSLNKGTYGCGFWNEPFKLWEILRETGGEVKMGSNDSCLKLGASLDRFFYILRRSLVNMIIEQRTRLPYYALLEAWIVRNKKEACLVDW